MLRVVQVVHRQYCDSIYCDFKACLEVNNMTSVLSSFNVNILLASQLRISPMQVFKRVTAVDCCSGALFSNETYSCVSSA